MRASNVVSQRVVVRVGPRSVKSRNGNHDFCCLAGKGTLGWHEIKPRVDVRFWLLPPGFFCDPCREKQNQIPVGLCHFCQ